MTYIEPGDIIFSFNKRRIAAVGVAVSHAYSSSKPDFGSAGANWSDEGWHVEVEFTEFNNRIIPANNMDRIGPLLPERYSPLRANGVGNQIYLAEISQELAFTLANLIGSEFEYAVMGVEVSEITYEKESKVEKELEMRLDLPVTERVQLTKARRGQGLFRSNVRIMENRCRVTGVTQLNMLRASHIKPWAVSDDTEKLTGFNGLLLSPHVDHLFDQGFITFADAGTMELSPKLELEVLERWKIPQVLNVGNFSEEQKFFLAHHRDNTFKQTA